MPTADADVDGAPTADADVDGTTEVGMVRVTLLEVDSVVSQPFGDVDSVAPFGSCI